MSKFFEKILAGAPRIERVKHTDDAFNTCDECERRPRDMLWVVWDGESQMCLDCFFKLSGGTCTKKIEIEVMRR